MKNCQLFNKSCSCYKYCCKYITKIDKQNYFIVEIDKHRTGKLVTKLNFLHNTKITSSKIQEEEENKKRKDTRLPDSKVISFTKMYHLNC